MPDRARTLQKSSGPQTFEIHVLYPEKLKNKKIYDKKRKIQESPQLFRDKIKVF